MEQRIKGRETETFSLYPSESRPILTQNSTDAAPQQRSLHPLLRVSISSTLSEYQLTRTLQNAMVQAEFRPREDICLRRWSSHYRRLPGECYCLLYTVESLMTRLQHENFDERSLLGVNLFGEV